MFFVTFLYICIIIINAEPEYICFKDESLTSLDNIAGLYTIQNGITYNNHSVWKKDDITFQTYISFGDIQYESTFQSQTWGFRRNSYTITDVLAYLDNTNGISDSCKADPTKCGSFIDDIEPTTDNCDPELYDFSLEASDFVWLVYAIIWCIILLCFMLPFGFCHKYCENDYFDGLKQSTYDEILVQRGYDCNQTATGDNRTLSLLVLRGDFRGGKMVWHDDYWKDFLVMFRLDHGLISSFYAPEQHPYTKFNRRVICSTALLLDFSFAVIVSYLVVWGNIFPKSIQDGFGGFLFDNGLSFIFGIFLLTMDTILSAIATCACVERCPNMCRKWVYRMGKCIILLSFTGALISIIGLSIALTLIAKESGSWAFWGKFILNFYTGLFQGWFLFDVILMLYEFRTEWKNAHKKKPENGEEPETARSTTCKIMNVIFHLMCFWLLCLTCWCCKRNKEDPYDDGQNEFGVNYHEYTKWKNGEPVGDRELTGRYTLLGINELCHIIHIYMLYYIMLI